MPRLDRQADKRRRRSKLIRQAQASVPSASEQRPLPEGEEERFKARIAGIARAPLSALSTYVDEARAHSLAHLQHDVVDACLARILGKTPRYEQVRTLRRLIFNKGDTLLIARTGWGKSIIFHAFSVLTRLITLQIIPLSKLGDEQLDDIRRLGDTRPVLVTSETKAKERDMFRRIRQNEYTHILLGPEQASASAFRELLKEPEVQSQIGLVAIDECHTVSQWSEFRPEFTMIGELRMILRRDIVWFACSATMDARTQQVVLDKAGFRPIGRHAYQTEVIRTSINRGDISLSVQPLARNKVGSFEALHFLLARAIDGQGGSVVATPQRIPKTIVFIDGRTNLGNAAAYLRDLLVRSTAACRSAGQYSKLRGAKKDLDVHTVVEEFSAGVATHDRDIRYEEFRSLTSRTRIMVATTSLGMGVNVPDVERVVVWRRPITDDLGDVWQRLGRGGRGPGRSSEGYLFLPYWMFDNEGRDRPVKRPQAVTSTTTTKARRSRHQLPNRFATHPATRLNNAYSQADLSDADSAGSQASEALQELESSAVPAGAALPSDTRNSCVVPMWSETEARQREELPILWKDMVNANCHRRVFLSFLGENELPEGAERIATTGVCCSACSPGAFATETIDFAPAEEEHVKKPRAGTKASIAMLAIDEWASQQVMSGLACLRMRLPAYLFMDDQVRWAVANLFGTRLSPVGAWSSTADLAAAVPSLLHWSHWEEKADDLVAMLSALKPRVDTEYAASVAKRRTARVRPEPAAVVDAGVGPAGNTVGSAHSQYTAETRRRDDTLAITVAKRLANRQLAEGTAESPEIDAVRRVAAIQADIQTFLEASPIRNESPPVVPRLATPDQTVDTPTLVANNAQTTPQNAARQPLQRRDPSIRQLSFSPVSARGRVRKQTAKGGENFR